MSDAATAAPDETVDVRPVVPTRSQSNWGIWTFGAVLLLGGVMLYNALSAAEDAPEVPSVLVPQDQSGARIASPAPLRTPERFDGPARLQEQTRAQSFPVAPRIAPRIAPQIIQPVQPGPIFPARPLPLPSPLPQQPSGPQVVFDGTVRAPSPPVRSQDETSDAERVSAGRLLNPSRTIPQGTVIPAVLETALDSTRAGGVRALVQRDISSFDGSRVLIPRGSRLYGEYESNLQAGQNRALVQWTRLIRPDGVTVALNSPSSDPLGRAGVRGRVDTKFLQRFGGAILQSVLDIGVGLAVNEASDGVFVALPGSTQNVQIAPEGTIQPTLRVRHGTSVSVFVSRDLDFSSVDP